MTRVSHALDRIDATFDNPNLVTNAGLLLVATMSERLGLERGHRGSDGVVFVDEVGDVVDEIRSPR